ncbi:MAG: IS200/IS605 family transposase [Phycisphaerales bacterium]|nr:IS200/IS605 family transposase [Phycisphaerales bacterium]
MASTLTKILIHVTFSTKNREPLIPLEIEKDLCAYVGGICRGHSSALLSMGGVNDHVHFLVSLGKTVALSDLMLNIKRDSSSMMKKRTGPDFAWQQGYFGFSLGESGSQALLSYIENQKTRHQHETFQEEVRKLCAKYNVALDERYAWD